MNIIKTKDLLDQTIKQLNDIYTNQLPITDKASRQTARKYVEDFYLNCGAEKLRESTMKLIRDCENLDFSILTTICLCFEESMKQNGSDADNSRINKNLWENSFNKTTKLVCWTALDLLFRIREPESDGKKIIIENTIQNLLQQEETNFTGRLWEQAFGNFGGNQVNNFSISTCDLWEKHYKYITVDSRDSLDMFVNEHMIAKRPRIIGFDCEAAYLETEKPSNLYVNKKHQIVLLQLATTEWVCLIDILKLLDVLTKEEWEKFFGNLFHQDVICVGFSVKNDYEFICNRFHDLKQLFNAKHTNILCLSKLSKLVAKKHADLVFHGNLPTSDGLAELAKVVLDIQLQKQHQNSNWKKRPLTDAQKFYAVMDALIVVLIYEEIKVRLESGYEINVEEIMKIGFMTKAEWPLLF